jgi:hypothetical protein
MRTFIKLLLPILVMYLGSVLPAAETESDPRLHANGGNWGFKPSPVKDPQLPHVLLIGDSVANGYSKTVISELEKKATVDLWLTPGHQGSITAKQISEVVGALPFAVIHFNLGLHGWVKGRIPDGKYEPLTHSLVQNIRAAAPRAKLIWASTTPVSVKGKPGELNPEINPIILDHNAMAAKVMAEEHVPIDDLYTLSVAHQDLMVGDMFHWKAPGSALQGKQVAEVIAKALAEAAHAK